MSGRTHEMDQALRALADAAAADIKLDFPGIDVNYDLYCDMVDGRWMGVVDMGEAFQAAFSWEADHWELSNMNPVAIRDRIVARRR